MTSSVDNQLSVAQSPGLASTTSENSLWLQGLGAELAFTQDATGVYLSFYWQPAEGYGLLPEQVVGLTLSQTFGPVALAPYMDRVRRVLQSRIPERFNYPFRYAEQYFLFELVVSPILTSSSDVTAVLVMGRLLQSNHSTQPGSGTEPAGDPV